MPQNVNTIYILQYLLSLLFERPLKKMKKGELKMAYEFNHYYETQNVATGQPQHGEGAHRHGIAGQQRRRCYGVAAQRKGRTKGHKNAERCAQKAQRRALAVIHRRQG